jgi:hypothetical protein
MSGNEHTTISQVLQGVASHVETLSPVGAIEFLQELSIKLNHYSLSITQGVIQPMVKAGRTEMLLVPPKQSSLIVPSDKIIT